MNVKGISAIQEQRTEPQGIHLRAMHPTDRRPLHEALQRDNAVWLAPTHVVERDGRIIGYGSGGVIRMIHGWTAPEVDDHVSLAALGLMERAAAADGAGVLAIAATDDCRFKPFLEREGWTKGQTVTIYYKKAKG